MLLTWSKETTTQAIKPINKANKMWPFILTSMLVIISRRNIHIVEIQYYTYNYKEYSSDTQSNDPDQNLVRYIHALLKLVISRRGRDQWNISIPTQVALKMD